MYAVTLDDTIIAPLVGTESQIKDFKLNYPEYILVECTLENSPMTIGGKVGNLL